MVQLCFDVMSPSSSIRHLPPWDFCSKSLAFRYFMRGQSSEQQSQTDSILLNKCQTTHLHLEFQHYGKMNLKIFSPLNSPHSVYIQCHFALVILSPMPTFNETVFCRINQRQGHIACLIECPNQSQQCFNCNLMQQWGSLSFSATVLSIFNLDKVGWLIWERILPIVTILQYQARNNYSPPVIFLWNDLVQYLHQWIVHWLWNQTNYCGMMSYVLLSVCIVVW